MPVDIVLLAIVVAGFLAIGLPLIVCKVSLPRRVEFEVVADHELAPDQSSHFAALDAELAELGYRPAGGRRATNMQGNALIRIYSSAADPAIITANLLTSQVPTGTEQSANYLEIVTQYRDGTILSTRNAEVSDVLDPLPRHILIERRGLTDAARLKRSHDAKAAELLAREPIHRRIDEFESAFNDHHERWCAHLVERGLLRPDGTDPDLLRPTARTGLRGIANFLNPLADNFTPLRFLVGALAGLALPGAALIWLRGPGEAAAETAAATLGLGPGLGVTLATAVILGLSGVAVGLVFVEKSFIWSFAFSYVLLRLVAPTGLWVTLLLCMWAGAVADLVARRRLAARKLA